jgi:hypothetical protein
MYIIKSKFKNNKIFKGKKNNYMKNIFKIKMMKNVVYKIKMIINKIKITIINKLIIL